MFHLRQCTSGTVLTEIGASGGVLTLITTDAIRHAMIAAAQDAPVTLNWVFFDWPHPKNELASRH